MVVLNLVCVDINDYKEVFNVFYYKVRGLKKKNKFSIMQYIENFIDIIIFGFDELYIIVIKMI